MVRIALAVAVLLVVAAAPPADAAQGSSAQRFADAALRAKSALRAVAPRVRSAHREVFRTCESGIEPDEDPPAHARRRAEVLAHQAERAPLVLNGRPVFDQLLDDLRRIPTRDPALRSGREGWRLFVELLFGEPVLPGACEQLAAWEATGYARDRAPAFRVADFKRPDAEDRRLGEESQARLERAGVRMFRLGVSEADALRFMAHELFAVLDPERDKARVSRRAAASRGSSRRTDPARP